MVTDLNLTFPFGASTENVRAHIIQHGCFMEVENSQLYREWFTYSRPRDHLLKQLDKRYHFSQGTVMDAGCGYGANVILGKPGSYGLEMDMLRCQFTRSIGIPCYERDLVEDDLSNLPQVDTVLCLATLEHIVGEHIVLRKLVERLRPGGILIVSVPARPVLLSLEQLPFFRSLYNEHGDHINGYTPQGLAFRCERAGTKRLEALRYSVPLMRRLAFLPFRVMNWFPFSFFSNACVYVGVRPEQWEYPAKATRRRADNAQGFIPVEGYLGNQPGRSQQME
jgi:SAM-dependent methyltransferase